MPLENLAEQLAAAARDLGSVDVEHTLQRAVALAVEIIEGCDGSGVDQLQYELQEGPCMDAVWEHDVIMSPDLAREGRWPT